jgi:hypothetical protein
MPMRGEIAFDMRGLLRSVLALSLAAVSVSAAEEPRYVIFGIMGPEAMGSSVGSQTAHWNASLQDSVAELREEFGAQTPGQKRYIGFSVALTPTLNLTPAQLEAQIVLELDLAERNGIPVFFHLDDQHFWWRSPELSGNPEMIEWSDFPKPGEAKGPAVARYWLPWGNPPSVYPAPPPCMACPAFRAAMARRLQDCVAAPIARRLKIWNETGRGYLFAGIASGNETQVVDLRASARAEWPVGPVGLDRSHDPPRKTTMDPEEMLPTGYHSLYALGYDRAAVESLAHDRRTTVEQTVESLLADVAHDYAEFQSKTLFDSGIPADRLYTHFTSSARSTRRGFESRPDASGRAGSGNLPPPIAAAVNRYSRPGFTVARDGADLDELVAQLAKAGAPDAGKAWAAVESYASTGQPGVPQSEAQYADYLGGLFGHGAEVVDVYGWNIPWIARSPYRIKSSGVMPAVKKWLSGAEFSAAWSGAREQATIAAVRTKMGRLPESARRAVARGRHPLAIRWIFWRFQSRFEPLMRANRYAEAEAALDRALAELE